MFLKLEIKTDLGWQEAVLPSDASIPMEDINPIFDTEAGGAFSYPFKLSVEANQHLFPTLTNHHGAHIYDLIYHKPFRLAAGGYPLLFGIIDLEDEVEIEEKDGTHSVSISLASNNQELKTLLDGVNAREIPLKNRIPVGTEFRYLDWDLHIKEKIANPGFVTLYKDFYSKCRTSVPGHIFSLNQYKTSLDGSGNWINSTNVQDPYPAKAYCNARVAVQAREKQSDGNYITLREYEVFDADRPNSGICFYVQYFLDCLFAYVNVAYDNAQLRAFEDFNRLAFFNTKCECDAVSTAFSLTMEEMKALLPSLDLGVEIKTSYQKSNIVQRDATFSANAWTKYANSKNFPDTDAFKIIEELQNAFGVRFIYDSEGQRCRAVFAKDVFNDHTAVKSAAIVHHAYHKDKDIRGVKMTYGGSDEDTSYNYDPNKENPASPVIIRNGYAGIRKEKGAYDRNTYYDTVTGNWFRIKVDEDAKTEDEWYPSLFEVGMFHDAWVGDTTKEATDADRIKEVSIGFSPVICNIVGKVEETSAQIEDGHRKRTSALSSKEQPQTAEDCQYAVFLDVELEDEQQLVLSESFSAQQWAKEDGSEPTTFWQAGSFGVKFWGRYGYSSDYMEKVNEYAKKYDKERARGTLKKPVVRYDEDPLTAYDAGFTLGIMRGPGNSAGVDVVQEDYDGNGNARWAFTPTGYAFTSDSIDHFGNMFDYNGTDQGGIDTDGRVSLKLQAEKVCRFQGEKVTDGQVKVSTQQEASYWLAYLFPDSNPDLLALRPVLKSALSAKGWSVTGLPNVVYIYPHIANGKMLNVIQDDGTVLTPSEANTYGANIPTRTVSPTTLRDSKNILIKDDAVQADINNIKALVNIYYFPDTAEPYTLTNVPATATTDYYPVASQHAHRGLLHKFNYELFWFLIHARTIVLDTTMTIQELRELDKNRWHTFGQYTGLIEKTSYEVNNETGLSHVEVTLSYL